MYLKLLFVGNSREAIRNGKEFFMKIRIPYKKELLIIFPICYNIQYQVKRSGENGESIQRNEGICTGYYLQRMNCWYVLA